MTRQRLKEEMEAAKIKREKKQQKRDQSIEREQKRLDNKLAIMRLHKERERYLNEGAAKSRAYETLCQ